MKKYIVIRLKVTNFTLLGFVSSLDFLLICLVLLSVGY